VDLHPDKVSNHEMGTIFEELIRKFSEQSNEEAGEHFTPRDVVKLMTNLIFIENGIHLKQENLIKKYMTLPVELEECSPAAKLHKRIK